VRANSYTDAKPNARAYRVINTNCGTNLHRNTDTTA
jgi:hypothetical protein